MGGISTPKCLDCKTFQKHPKTGNMKTDQRGARKRKNHVLSLVRIVIMKDSNNMNQKPRMRIFLKH